ncbi:hypothetical protein BDN70DRAFT_375893 [Pholiota conissans]|uniref:Uncharacterized protein n=1 Tax=Pholiota conissans TaxID=109636 RepID=A0A9P5YRZ0_9AGAR|nr:hypothetical protein BDN70DRAFT_375893 [Pholiota conissans]
MVFRRPSIPAPASVPMSVSLYAILRAVFAPRPSPCNSSTHPRPAALTNVHLFLTGHSPSSHMCTVHQHPQHALH